MTPGTRRRLAAAAAAGACAIVYLWMLFAWETAWGIDLKHRDSPAWLVGTFCGARTHPLRATENTYLTDARTATRTSSRAG